MAHLVAPLRDLDLQDALQQLDEAHEFLGKCCVAAVTSLRPDQSSWGVLMKRHRVDLSGPGRPASVLKTSERFVEVVNMVATLERLIAALRFFQSRQQEWGSLRVRECHPSTSSTVGGNDLVLEGSGQEVVVKCEVCDIVSQRAGSNGKEQKDLESLGCAGGIPADGVRRFICTSPEFAQAIASPDRKWEERHYRYRRFEVGDEAGTELLEIVTP